MKLTNDLVLHVDGFALERGTVDGEFRIRDIELAERLGYDRPRDIRKVIERMIERGELPGLSPRATVARGKLRGKTHEEIVVDEYWLDRIEALLVIMKSETPNAAAMCRVMATAFDKVLRQYEESRSVLRRFPEHIERWFLSPSALDFQALWPDSLISELERLHGRVWVGGRHPHHMKSTYPAIYRMVMSSPIAAKMMDGNPDRDRLRHHQFITPEARPFVVAQLSIVEALARQSAAKASFWVRMDRQYGGGLLQLAFGDAP